MIHNFKVILGKKTVGKKDKSMSIRLLADFSAKCYRREWNDIFKILKNKNCQPRILYLVTLSLSYERVIKVFLDKTTTTTTKQAEKFTTTRPPFQQMLKHSTNVKRSSVS